MNILMSIGTLIFVMLTIFSTASYVQSSRDQSMQIKNREAVIEATQMVGTSVRFGRDRYIRTTGTCQPPALLPRALASGGGICWPTARGGCLDMQNGYRICLANNQALSSSPLPFHFSIAALPFALFRSQPLKAAITPVPDWATGPYYDVKVPPPLGTTDGRVQLRPGTCAGPTGTGCINCNYAGTECFTVVFCVGKGTSITANCGAADRIAQTFARRDL